MIGLVSHASLALTLLFLSTTASVLPRSRSGNPKAVYFMTNDAGSNSIVALPVAANGQLSDGTFTATGGAGGIETNLSTRLPVTSDALSSQGSMRVSGNNLFAVNAGSNTLSMFSINPNDPTDLKLLGKPVSTTGEFPVSLAVSAKNRIVCVANSGAVSGVSCGSFHRDGLEPMDPLRPLFLNQSTPAVGPFDDVGSTFFNAEETALLTTVKRNRTETTGFLSVFSVNDRRVGTSETRSFVNGTQRLFGAVPIPNTNNIFSSDAGFGSVILRLNANNTASLVARTIVADQATTCWAIVASRTGTGFLSDNDVNHLVEVDVTTGAIITDYFPPNSNPGMTELHAAGNYIYALSPGRANRPVSVVVFDVSGGRGTLKQVQNFFPKNVPLVTAEGMQSF